MFKIKNVENVRVSPNGQLVLYNINEAVIDGDKNDYLSHIFLARTDGSNITQITQGEKSCIKPEWSPDGKLIAYLSDKSGKNNIWLIDPGNGKEEQLTDVETSIVSFKWAPDNKKIAYVLPDSLTADQVKKQAIVKVRDEDFQLNRLWVISIDKDLNGGHVKRLLTKESININPGFDWSSDGKSIVFTFSLTPATKDLFSTYLSIINVETGNVRLITREGISASMNTPSFSPDGHWIAYVSDEGKDIDAYFKKAYVCIVEITGDNPKKMVEVEVSLTSLVGWSNDNKRVYVIENKKTKTRLFAVSVADTSKQYLNKGVEVIEDINLNASRTMVGFRAQHFNSPPEVFVSGLDRFNPVKVSQANQSLMEHTFGHTEVIHWTSNDGAIIEGLLTLPIGYKSEKRYPLLVVVHAGGEVFSEWCMANPFPSTYCYYPPAVFAAQGYCVLLCNCRGGALFGYGLDYLLPVFKPDEKAYPDIMSGVNHLINIGVADSNRMAIMGWSNGGLVTSWVITQTNRFHAASVGAGFPDLVGMAGSNILLPADLKAEFWEDMTPYLKTSPIFQVGKISIPTLIQHGENDMSVPLSQGNLLYQILKRRGIPTKMLVYTNAGHVPSSPKQVIDIAEQNLEWFNRYLKD